MPTTYTISGCNCCGGTNCNRCQSPVVLITGITDASCSDCLDFNGTYELRPSTFGIPCAWDTASATPPDIPYYGLCPTFTGKPRWELRYSSGVWTVIAGNGTGQTLATWTCADADFNTPGTSSFTFATSVGPECVFSSSTVAVNSL